MLGQDTLSCGATRLDAVASTQRIPTYADFVNEVSAPSPILAISFLFALESPFGPVFFIAIPPPATLLKEVTVPTTLSHRFMKFLYHTPCFSVNHFFYHLMITLKQPSATVSVSFPPFLSLPKRISSTNKGLTSLRITRSISLAPISGVIPFCLISSPAASSA